MAVTSHDAGYASPTRYTAVATFLHWVIAVGIIAMLIMGVIMTNVPLGDEGRFVVYQVHKSIGLLLLAAVIVRLGWRFIAPPPALPDHMGTKERIGAHAGHLGLYGLMFALPITGWLMVSAAGIQVPTKIFYVIPVPHLLGLDQLPSLEREQYEYWFALAHEVLGYGLAGLLAVHAGAALHHHYIKQDNVLMRMAPGRGVVAAVTGLSVGLAAIALASPRLPALLAPSAPTTVVAEKSGALDDALADGQRAAPAGTWLVDRAKSKLGFVATGAGTELVGSFAAYDATIIFKPDDLAATSVEVTIDMASAATVSGQYDETLKGADWFDTQEHPTASYTAHSATRSGDSQGDGADFVLDGELTLRGVTRPLSLPFRFASTQDGTASVQVSHPISRSAFGVGPTEGFAGAVDDQVQLNFELIAARPK